MIEPQIITKTVKTVVAGQVVSLGEVEVEDPSLVLSTYEVVVIGDKSTIEYEPPIVELSYLGEGTITVTNPNPTALSATYDSVTRTITLVSNQSEEDDEVDVNLTVSLSKLGNCVTESVTLTVHCFPLLLNPELNVTVYEEYAGGGNVACFPISFLGNGTVTALIGDSPITYDAENNQLVVTLNSYYYTATLTVSVGMSLPYCADTKTYSFYVRDPKAPL